MLGFVSFLAGPLQDYLELKTRLGFTSFARHGHSTGLDRYLASQGTSSFAELNEELLLRWMSASPERAAKTKNQMLIFARGLFEYLVRHAYLADNPARQIRSLKEKPYRPYLYTLYDIHQILEAARSHRIYKNLPLSNQTLETLIFLLYACGLRLSEALNLKVKDVNFQDLTLSLWKTKFHKERLIPFSPAVSDKLRQYLARRAKQFRLPSTEAPFFCHAKGKYSRGVIQKHFRKIVAGIGLANTKPRPRLHDLRHAFAVHRLYKWYQEGCDIQNKLPYLSTYMGHVSLDNTQVYLTITTALLREADRRFQDSFEDLAKTPIGRVFKKR